MVVSNEAKGLNLGKDEQIRKLTDQIFSVLSNTVEAKDSYTNGHSQRVAQYSKEIVRRMGWNEDQQLEVYYAGLLHDIGKIRVPIGIINKKGPLDKAEYEEMKLHTLAGYYILKEVSSVSDFAVAARWHHERYDGNGYPNGLSGENIPLICRIISVADSYDAMTSYRSYRPPMSQELVSEQLRSGMGTQYDPAIAQIMLDIIADDKDFDLREDAPPKYRTVLAVDDDSMVLSSVKYFLERSDYKLVTANSADECIKILKERNDISLVLLDVEMPDKDGFYALEWIRKNENDMPVIFMTGEREMEIIQKAEKMGISDYLTKPLVPKMLVESVHSVLSIRRHWHGVH